MGKDDVRLQIRRPKDLHEAIVRLANNEERSLNGQLVWLLRQALKAQESDRPPS